MQLDVTTDESFRSFLPGHNQEDDRALIIRFFVDKALLGLKSKEAGRPIYEDREYVEIRIKGQPKQVVVKEVDAKIAQKYPHAYAAFKAGREAPVVGMPIEQLPGVGPSMAVTLKTFGVRSVEDMAALSDMGLQSIGGGARELQRRAKAFLEQSTEKTVALAEENNALKAQLEAMNARLSAIEGGGEKQPKKPKRAYVRKAKPVNAPGPDTQQ